MLTAAAGAVSSRGPGVYLSTVYGRRTCTVLSQGNKKDDVRNIRKTFKKCARNSTIAFIEDQVYWIDEKIYITQNNIKVG